MNWVVNIWSVLIAGLSAAILGMLWYSKLLFGDQWMKLSGIKMPSKAEMKKAQAGMWKSMVIQFVGSALAAYTLGLIINLTTRNSLYGAVWGVIVAVGVLSVNALTSVLWEGKPLKLYFINISYNIVSYAIMGAILGCSSWA